MTSEISFLGCNLPVDKNYQVLSQHKILNANLPLFECRISQSTLV